MDRVSAGGIDANTFADSRTEIYTLMKRDTLPRFLKTDTWAEVLASFDEPGPMPECTPPSSLAVMHAALKARMEGLTAVTGNSNSDADRATASIKYTDNFTDKQTDA